MNKSTQNKIELTLKALKLDYVAEYNAIPGRRFRFDYAIPSLMIAIEYEGIISTKSRHTSVTGYTNDCTKYNLAQMNGWIVLRYTQLNLANLYDDLQLLITNYNKKE
jgi:hypothetical protein